MAGEYEFSKKAHRLTSPPANKSAWLPGYEGVGCKLLTDPALIAVACREATWGSIYDAVDDFTPEIIASTLEEIKGGKVLGAALEIPSFAFVMRGSRSTMDQLLRLRESAGAAHTTRDNDFRNFNIIVPNTIESLKDDNTVPSKVYDHKDAVEMMDEVSIQDTLEKGEGWSLTGAELHSALRRHTEMARALYGAMVEHGIPPQDARYLCLPLGYQGDWIQVMNLRAFVKECEQRLCNGLTQHESNYMVRLQRDLVVEQYPWMAEMLRSSCEKRGMCASRTMLFPKCGAFGGEPGDSRTAMERAQVSYHPNDHLYPPEQNDGMQFAEWDKERAALVESGYPLELIKFSKPPSDQLMQGGCSCEPHANDGAACPDPATGKLLCED